MRYCQRHDCERPVSLQDAREEDAGDVVIEEYECSNGHTSHETVPTEHA